MIGTRICRSTRGGTRIGNDRYRDRYTDNVEHRDKDRNRYRHTTIAGALWMRGFADSWSPAGQMTLE